MKDLDQLKAESDVASEAREKAYAEWCIARAEGRSAWAAVVSAGFPTSGPERVAWGATEEASNAARKRYFELGEISDAVFSEYMTALLAAKRALLAAKRAQ